MLKGDTMSKDVHNTSIKPHEYNQPIPTNKYNPLAWISEEVKIGENCWIGAGCVITGNVTIGNNVSLACGVKIHDHDTSYYRSSEGKEETKYYKITICDNVHIGANSVIIPKNKDITIGNNSIIGALSLVRHSVPPYVVVAGIPAKFKKYLNVEITKYCTGCTEQSYRITKDGIIHICKYYNTILKEEEDTGRLFMLPDCKGVHA